MNVAVNDSHKRTSISQLLNPLGNNSPEATAQSSESLERTPRPSSAASQNDQNAQNGGESSSIHSPGSSFQLRSASWEQRNGLSKGTDGPDPPRPFHFNPHSEGPHGDPRGTSRLRDGPSSTPGHGGAWPARHEVPNMPYGTPVITPMYSAERTAISGDLGSNQPRNHNQGNQPDQSPSNVNSPAWQSTERASTRLVARGTAQEQATTGQHPYALQVYSGFILPPPGYPLSHPLPPLTQPSNMQSPQPTPAQPSQKRRATDGEDSSAGPKTKKAKSKAKTPADGSSSKRGYNAKKRSEAAQIAAQNATLIPTVSYSPQQPNEQAVKATRIDQDPEGSGALHPELQFARCMSNRYKSEKFPRCVACTRRWAGDTCRFQGIRFFLKDNNRKIVGISFVENEKADAPTMTFPAQWNVPLKPEHIRRTKRAVALSLLPTLRQEMKHLETPEIIRRPRESEVRATCDTCMTSLFSSSWMCRLCGREACAECFDTVRDLTEDREGATPGDKAALQLKRENHAHSNPFFLSCTKRNEHGAKDFSPMSRFCKAELGDAIAEMEALLETPDVDALPVDGIIDSSLGTSTSTSHTNGASEGSATTGPSNFKTVLLQTDEPTQPDSSLPITAQVDPSLASDVPAKTPSHSAKYYTHEELTDDVFRPLWQKGEPLVVTGLSSKFQIPWTPDYFIEKHGTQSCLIVECQTDVNKRITVGEFFSMFGKYEGRTECWKLKDWPSSTDFKSAFPGLYEDFSRAVPVPNYVRRDGTLNVASHFPFNTIGPDLGPKMYNAMASFQTVGSKGSTRLHMDMSDALNIMTFSTSTPDGNPGTAAWDLFRAEDSNKIRVFLKKKFRSNLPLHDPIHSQQFYLDDEALAELWRDYDVKSFRIYQKPGEAVFIPAGCAHQVCNLADCVKVAIDFVSPENIERCENLTKEFREQNQSMVWKEDVLQLRTMMWYAWLSCRMQEKEL